MIWTSRSTLLTSSWATRTPAFTVIGKSQPRRDARDKVTGAARHAGDLAFPGMLHARIVRPPAHGATLTRTDTAAAEAFEGARVLAEEVRFKGGEILDRNFDTYEIPRFSWLPQIETILVDNPDVPASGCGEPPVVCMGAVVANAIYDAVGARLFQLPMTPVRVKEALEWACVARHCGVHPLRRAGQPRQVRADELRGEPAAPEAGRTRPGSGRCARDRARSHQGRRSLRPIQTTRSAEESSPGPLQSPVAEAEVEHRGDEQ